MFQTLTELLKPTKLNPKDGDQENDVFKCNIDLIYFFSLSLSNKYYISMLKLFCFINISSSAGHLIDLGDNFEWELFLSGSMNLPSGSVNFCPVL